MCGVRVAMENIKCEGSKLFVEKDACMYGVAVDSDTRGKTSQEGGVLVGL